MGMAKRGSSRLLLPSSPNPPVGSLSCCSDVPVNVSYADICGPSAGDEIDSLIVELSHPVPPEGDARIEDALKLLWRVAFDGETPPPVPDPTWRRLGFQGSNPMTDLRGASWAGLEYLISFLESGPGRVVGSGEARALALAAADGLPLGIAAMNVIFMLRAHLRLFREPPSFCPCCGVRIRGQDASPADRRRTARAMRGFATLLKADPDALLQVYSLSLLLASMLWLRQHTAALGGADGETARVVAHVQTAASEARAAGRGDGGDERLLAFPRILQIVCRRVMAALDAAPESAKGLRRELRIDRTW